MRLSQTRAQTIASCSLMVLTVAVTATYLWGGKIESEVSPPSISAIGSLPRPTDPTPRDRPAG